MKTGKLTNALRASALAIATAATPAQAAEPYAMTPQEMSQLPEWCHVKLLPELASEQPPWRQRFGELWGDLHHYCHGLKSLNRGNRLSWTKLDRAYELNAAVGEFDYVLRAKAAQGHWFLPEVHMQKANALRALGRHVEANNEVQHALKAQRAPGAR